MCTPCPSGYINPTLGGAFLNATHGTAQKACTKCPTDTAPNPEATMCIRTKTLPFLLLPFRLLLLLFFYKVCPHVTVSNPCLLSPRWLHLGQWGASPHTHTHPLRHLRMRQSNDMLLTPGHATYAQ